MENCSARQNLRPNQIDLGPKSVGQVAYRHPGMQLNQDRDDELKIIKFKTNFLRVGCCVFFLPIFKSAWIVQITAEVQKTHPNFLTGNRNGLSYVARMARVN